MSRLRENPEKLFEVFLEVGKPTDEKSEPFILQKYPPDYSDEEVLKSAPKFAFPCNTERTTVDHFTFTMTDLESKYKFGFCRHSTGAQTCLCIVRFGSTHKLLDPVEVIMPVKETDQPAHTIYSCFFLPWFEIFYSLLNHLAEIMNRTDGTDLTVLLRAALADHVPIPNQPVTFVGQQEMFSFTAPDPSKMPSIPASRNLTEYYNAIDTNNMLIIFASMLKERRILVSSKKLSRLTACVHAAEAMLYPMHWQHLYIPVLPESLIDYISAPMPYIIGVHHTVKTKIKNADLGDAVVVDADTNTVITDYDDVDDLPEEIESHLKKYLKSEKVKNSMQGTGDAISKAFMMALVKLIGGYRDALKFQEGETITFNPEAFIQSRPLSMQRFLENMFHLQIFQQFINERLDMLNAGKGFSDLFEREAITHADKLNAQSRYKEWLNNMKKQGKKVQKGSKDIWADFKEKAGPVMTNAVESVKSQGKKAYSGFRTKIGDLKKGGHGKYAHDIPSSVQKWREDASSIKASKSVRYGTETKTFVRDRPSTIVGQELVTRRPPRPAPPHLDPSRVVSRPPGAIVNKLGSANRVSRLMVSEPHDDTNLMYNRVSISLLNDPDIQQAMFKSASVENLPHAHTDSGLMRADSSGQLSQSSVTSSDTESDHNIVPYIDDHLSGQMLRQEPDDFISYVTLDNDSTDSSSRESSVPPLSETILTSVTSPPYRPIPAPRTPSENQIQDRSIRQPPKVPPRPTLRTHPIKMNEPLIRLDSFESESNSSMTGETDNSKNVVGFRERPGLSRNKTDRQSLTRSPALKYSGHKRPNLKRDQSSKISEQKLDVTQSGNPNLYDFDPLIDNTPSEQVSNAFTESLMKSWDLMSLTSGNEGNMRSSPNIYQTMAQSSQPAVKNSPGYFSAQGVACPSLPDLKPKVPFVLHRPKSEIFTHHIQSNPDLLTDMQTTTLVDGSDKILQPQNTSSQNEKQDPFADLVDLKKKPSIPKPVMKQGSSSSLPSMKGQFQQTPFSTPEQQTPISRPEKLATMSGSASVQAPVKITWETFD